jgi:hypothetical protein
MSLAGLIVDAPLGIGYSASKNAINACDRSF